MSISKSQLLGINIQGVNTVCQHFEEGRSSYNTAEEDFGVGVADPLRSGHQWRGEGVPNATSVMEINASALAASRVIMDSAWLALDGFASAMEKAQKKLHSAMNDCAGRYVVINEDGSAEPSKYIDPNFCPEPSTCTTPTSEQFARWAKAKQDAEWIEREAKGALEFARIADQSCALLLDRLSGNTPNTSEEADPALLANNRQALAGALYSRNLALLARNFWHEVTPKDMPKPEERHWSVGGLVLDVVSVAGSTAGLVSSIMEDATGIGAVLGVAQGTASAGALVTSFGQLVKDAHGTTTGGGGYKLTPPKDGNAVLKDVDDVSLSEADYRRKLNDALTSPDGNGQGYTPDPNSAGAPPRLDGGKYVEIDGIDPRHEEGTDHGSKLPDDESVVVDTKTGHVYYTDDNGRSYIEIK